MISRGEYGVLGPEDDCWPQMACGIPSDKDEVPMHVCYFSFLFFFLPPPQILDLVLCCFIVKHKSSDLKAFLSYFNLNIFIS